MDAKLLILIAILAALVALDLAALRYGRDSRRIDDRADWW